MKQDLQAFNEASLLVFGYGHKAKLTRELKVWQYRQVWNWYAGVCPIPKEVYESVMRRARKKK